MTSKVLMKLPTVPFSQGKKPSTQDFPSLNERNDGVTQQNRLQNTGVDRAAQLEQNMRFLQEQHQATLVALHQEVEMLRQRNRDLQFQLVFSKGMSCVPTSSPSSPEDNGNGFVKPKGSPACVNVTPLQVELLEKDLQDIKVSLQDAKAHNQYLSEVIEQQKKSLEAVEQKKEKLSTTDVGIQVESTESSHTDLMTRLEDAEAMVKRLRRENTDQRKEIATLKVISGNSGGSSRGGRTRESNAHHSQVSPTAGMQESTSHKFPPLQTQSYWHRRTRNGRSRHEKRELHTDTENTLLPQLQNGSIKSETVFESPLYRTRGYHQVHNREGNNRKYRGQMTQRDRRDPENRYHRRDYKDRNSKDYQRECTDAAAPEGSRDADSSHYQ